MATVGWLLLLAGALILGSATWRSLIWQRYGWRAVAFTAAITVLVWLAVFLEPAFEGFHLGCDVLAGDRVRWVHWGLLWCR